MKKVRKFGYFQEY